MSALTWSQWQALSQALGYIALGALGVCLGIFLEKWDRRQRS